MKLVSRIATRSSYVISVRRQNVLPSDTAALRASMVLAEVGRERFVGFFEKTEAVRLTPV